MVSLSSPPVFTFGESTISHWYAWLPSGIVTRTNSFFCKLLFSHGVLSQQQEVFNTSCSTPLRVCRRCFLNGLTGVKAYPEWGQMPPSCRLWLSIASRASWLGMQSDQPHYGPAMNSSPWQTVLVTFLIAVTKISDKKQPKEERFCFRLQLQGSTVYHGREWMPGEAGTKLVTWYQRSKS